MLNADYYAALGVNRAATADDLKRAYRRLAVKWHPDRNPGSSLAEERFKAISEAYAVLQNPVKRRHYDRLGPAEFKNEYSREKIFQGFDPGDFFQFFGLADAREILNEVIDGNSRALGAAGRDGDYPNRASDLFAGFGQKNTPRDRRSQDIIIPLLVSFKEAALGAEKCAAYNTPAGVAVKVSVQVPAGAVSGQKLVLRGQGPALRPGQTPGDLIVTLTVSPDRKFGRRGFDLLTRLELEAGDLKTGCRPLVEALTGSELRLTVPPDTASGAIFKIPAHGLPRPDGGRGNLLIKVIQK
jgi:curved DNA-binding protein